MGGGVSLMSQPGDKRTAQGPWAEASGGAGSWVLCEALLVSLSLWPDNGPQEVLILDSVTVTLYGKKDFAAGNQ